MNVNIIFFIVDNVFIKTDKTKNTNLSAFIPIKLFRLTYRYSSGTWSSIIIYKFIIYFFIYFYLFYFCIFIEIIEF